jgi:hypothetical protein
MPLDQPMLEPRGWRFQRELYLIEKLRSAAALSRTTTVRKAACLATLTAYEVATPPMRDILPRLKWVPWPGARTRKRWRRNFNRTSPVFRATAGVAAAAVLALAINGIYQVIRKPSELLFPVSGTLYKTPAETWRQYAPLFREYATEVMTFWRRSPRSRGPAIPSCARTGAGPGACIPSPCTGRHRAPWACIK